jgi:hypothetical protein
VSEQDIIERVPDNQPCSWVSPPVIAPKPDSNGIRFCIDMRMANKAIQRLYTQIPTMADIVNKFQGAERFTKLDLKEAYHQFVLDEQSALTSNGITVNPDKCVFDVEEVRFVGLVINKQGIKPDPKKVKNLQDASQPTSKVELRSFLGMAWFRNAPNANTTIAAMEKIFTNKGVPVVCQSDNG